MLLGWLLLAKRQRLDMEVELIAKRGRITELEAKLNSLKSSRQKAHIDCETLINALQKDLEVCLLTNIASDGLCLIRYLMYKRP